MHGALASSRLLYRFPPAKALPDLYVIVSELFRQFYLMRTGQSATVPARFLFGSCLHAPLAEMLQGESVLGPSRVGGFTGEAMCAEVPGISALLLFFGGLLLVREARVVAVGESERERERERQKDGKKGLQKERKNERKETKQARKEGRKERKTYINKENTNTDINKKRHSENIHRHRQNELCQCDKEKQSKTETRTTRKERNNATSSMAALVPPIPRLEP